MKSLKCGKQFDEVYLCTRKAPVRVEEDNMRLLETIWYQVVTVCFVRHTLKNKFFFNTKKNSIVSRCPLGKGEGYVNPTHSILILNEP